MTDQQSLASPTLADQVSRLDDLIAGWFHLFAQKINIVNLLFT